MMSCFLSLKLLIRLGFFHFAIEFANIFFFSFTSILMILKIFHKFTLNLCNLSSNNFFCQLNFERIITLKSSSGSIENSDRLLDIPWILLPTTVVTEFPFFFNAWSFCKFNVELWVPGSLNNDIGFLFSASGYCLWQLISESHGYEDFLNV